MLVEPFGQIVDAALVETPPVESEGKPFRPGLIVMDKDMLQPPLQPPRVVLERAIEHVTMHRHEVAKADARSGDRDGDIERHPGLALLRLAGEQRHPFGEQPRE